MDSNCTDTSNENYQLFWFNYFVSIGYTDNSDAANPYAPYGKCTRSLLWLTYLINIVHFFLLSSGILYLLTSHRNHSGFCWPFINWISSFAFLTASIVLFIFRNLNIRLFSILIIASQLSTLIILWISIFVVITCTFKIEYRCQRCVFVFMIILFPIETCCFIAQALITLHCLFNLKFISSSLDYAYWSAIIAAGGTVVSTLLLDYIFIWCVKRKMSARVSPAPISQPNENQNRATSPIDSVILEDFHSQSGTSLSHVYNNNDQTRQFHIQPTNRQLDGKRSSVLQKRNLGDKRNIHHLSTASQA